MTNYKQGLMSELTDAVVATDYDPSAYEQLAELVDDSQIQPQQITVWYFFTLMSGVGRCYVKGETFRGTVYLKGVEINHLEPAGVPTVSVTIEPKELK